MKIHTGIGKGVCIEDLIDSLLDPCHHTTEKVPDGMDDIFGVSEDELQREQKMLDELEEMLRLEEEEEIAAAVLIAIIAMDHCETADPNTRHQAYVRQRKSLEQIYEEYGDSNFRRAYRMSHDSFIRLHNIIGPSIIKAAKRCGGRKKICSKVRLSSAIRFFAGGSVWDIMVAHGISRAAVYDSIWAVVDAVNLRLPTIQFPKCKEKQAEIAKAFSSRSECGIDNCCGCMDGLLLWVEQPSKESCEILQIGPRKFFCARKHKFGMNLQAVCDHERRFLVFSITNPGAASDYLSFISSEFYNQLTDQNNPLLKEGLTIFGDNAYVNTSYMTVPFPNATGVQDDYNFFQSQLRINIECAFGIFTSRWRILKQPFSNKIILPKTMALCMCLAKLHNFCIDERLKHADSYTESAIVPSHFCRDLLNVYDHNNPEQPPAEFLGGGHHFDDVGGGLQNARAATGHERAQRNYLLPRQVALLRVTEGGYKRYSRDPKEVDTFY